MRFIKDMAASPFLIKICEKSIFRHSPAYLYLKKEKKGGCCAEQKQMEMLSALMGEEGQDAAKCSCGCRGKGWGAPQDTALPPAPQEEADVFAQPQGKYDFRRHSLLNREYSEGSCIWWCG